MLEVIRNNRFLFNIEKSFTKINRIITTGEIACTLSHIRAWKKFALEQEIQEDKFAIMMISSPIDWFKILSIHSVR